MTGAGLSASQAARRLGVAPTTLRTWHQRYGLGPGGHQPGLHRRYTDQDIVVLSTMARLTAGGMPPAEAARIAGRTTAPAPGHPPDPSAARGVARAARRLDVLGVRETLAGLVADRGVVAAWHAVIAPAFVHLSRARIPEMRRNAARRVLGRGASEVFAAVPRPPAGSPVPVMLVAVDAGRDVAALDALTAALAERGVAARHFGAGMHPEMLADVVARTRPTVVVLWGHAWHVTSPVLLRAVSTSAYRPVVLVAGQGWPDGLDGDLLRCPALADAAQNVIAAVLGRSGR